MQHIMRPAVLSSTVMLLKSKQEALERETMLD